MALWDVKNIETFPNRQPHPCGNKEMNVGKLFSVQFYPSSPWLLGCGGSGNSLALWDLTREEAIQKRFGDRVDASLMNNTHTENEEDVAAKEKDFEAMMAVRDASMEKSRQEATSGKNKKKKNKKKVHKRRG